MKICDLTYAYSRGGGITTYINNKRKVYQKRGISHLIITPRQDEQNQTEVTTNGSASIYYVPARKIKIQGLDYFFFRRFKDIQKILQQIRPDILEIGDSFTVFFYGRRLKKIIKGFNGKIFFFAHERLDNFYRQVFPVGIKKVLGQFWATCLRRRILKIADIVLANSDFTAAEIKPLNKKPVFIVPLGLDLEQFKISKDPALYNQLSQNGSKKIIIHVGRLERDKKVDLLVEWAKLIDHSKYQLVVLGNGLFTEQLAKIEGVTLAGFLPPPQVRQYLAVADLGILVNDIEPYGLVGLEMMAFGLPILGPNQGGLPTFLRPEFAWLLPHQAKDYLVALQKWENLSPEKKAAMSQAALKEIEKYDLDTMVDKLLKIYQS